LGHIEPVVRPSEHYSSLSNREKWRRSALSAHVVLRLALRVCPGLKMTDPEANTIHHGNCIEIMKGWHPEAFDHCIADPPFNISKKRGLGWAFSSHITMNETWDRFTGDEFFQFNLAWLTEVCRLVRPNGNILVFGTYHNIYQLGFILQHLLNRRILNSIIWFKPNAQPNITARTLTESTEQIIWAVNGTPEKAKKWTFNYQIAKALAGGKQMRTVWSFPTDKSSIFDESTGEGRHNLWEIPYTPASEKKHGKHPSQKPEALLDRLIQIGTNEGDTILDPFGGAGTTAISALKLHRKYVLIESVPEYVELIQRRIAAVGETI